MAFSGSFPISTIITIRIDSDMKDRLDLLPEAAQRCKSLLAAEAIRSFIDINEWPIDEGQAALGDADAGDFAADADVAALARNWKHGQMRICFLKRAGQPSSRTVGAALATSRR